MNKPYKKASEITENSCIRRPNFPYAYAQERGMLMLFEIRAYFKFQLLEKYHGYLKKIFYDTKLVS